MLNQTRATWYAMLSTWQPDLRGRARALCTLCNATDLRTAAGFIETDPHEVVHELVSAVWMLVERQTEHLTWDAYDEDSGDDFWKDDAIAQRRADGMRMALEAYCLELAWQADHIRRAMELHALPKVDEFVAASSEFIPVTDS